MSRNVIITIMIRIVLSMSLDANSFMKNLLRVISGKNVKIDCVLSNTGKWKRQNVCLVRNAVSSLKTFLNLTKIER